jgi:hypothetical protein
MAAVAMAPQPPRLFPLSPEHESINSLDPRTPSTSSTVSRNDSVLDEKVQQDVNEQIAKLSEKLVDSINHQTSLDDSLQQTRHELEAARRTIADLEAKAKQHSELISKGLLLPKEEAEQREAKVRADVAAEQELRTRAEKEKKNMEQELESLTSALFQEANIMVSSARKETEASEKKSEQLRNQLRDTEVLLESQQAQLQDLKAVLEKVTEEQAETESIAQASTSAPSTPAILHSDRMSRLFDSAHIAPAGEDAAPDHPLHFSHLIQPVLRMDVQAFEDFATVIRAAKAASPPPSRVASGSFGSLAAVTGASSALSAQSSSSSPSLSPMPGNYSPRSSTSGPPPLPTMRDTKLFKRAMTEDIEPTLRLDIAPGVSWMVRRAVMNSIVDGSLVVEPMPPAPVKFRGPVNPCALCGENRVGELYERKHRFRISEDKETRRFPLCELCLGRLRSCGDLLSFLRMVTNGHWKADSDEELKSAWEEYVRLRERMFWHRVSGGVIPAFSFKESTSPKNGSEGRRSEEDIRKTSGEDPFGTDEPANASSDSAADTLRDESSVVDSRHTSASETTLNAEDASIGNYTLSISIPASLP